MSSLVSYGTRGVKVLSPAPTGAGGAGLNANFQAIDDVLAALQTAVAAANALITSLQTTKADLAGAMFTGDIATTGTVTGANLVGAIAAGQITSGTVGTARLGTGVANNTKFLRGDSTWQVITLASLPDYISFYENFSSAIGACAALDGGNNWTGDQNFAGGSITAGSFIGPIDHSHVTGLGSAATLNANNAPNQVPLLDGSGLLPSSVIPPLAISQISTVASQAAMLALTAQRGDVAVRSDLSKTYILSTDDPTQRANWIELLGAGEAPVQSVNGYTGTFSLVKSDVGLANVANVDQTNAANITSGTVGTARLGSGAANNTKFLRGDSTWQTLNLAALPDWPTAYANLASGIGACGALDGGNDWTGDQSFAGSVTIGTPDTGDRPDPAYYGMAVVKAIASIGFGAGFQFDDRDDETVKWQFYSQGSIFRIWRSDIGDVFWIDPSVPAIYMSDGLTTYQIDMTAI